MEGLLKRIENHRNRFSKGQNRIADYIVRYYDRAALMTAAKLGEAVGVSESTVVRFAYSIGMDGYPEMQEAMQELLRRRQTTLQRSQAAASIPEDEMLHTILSLDMNNIRQTMDLIDAETFSNAVRLIARAKHVYIIGIRSAYAAAQFFAYYLSFIREDVVIVSGMEQDAFDKMIRIGSDDVCFGMSFPRYNVHTLNAMRFAKEHGAKIIALTDNQESPAAALSDCTLCARSDIASFADSLVAPLSVLNALLSAVGKARQDSARKSLAELERIWSREGMYLTDREPEDKA